MHFLDLTQLRLEFYWFKQIYNPSLTVFSYQSGIKIGRFFFFHLQQIRKHLWRSSGSAQLEHCWRYLNCLSDFLGRYLTWFCCVCNAKYAVCVQSWTLLAFILQTRVEYDSDACQFWSLCTIYLLHCSIRGWFCAVCFKFKLKW